MEIRSATWHYTDAMIACKDGAFWLGVVREGKVILVQRISRKFMKKITRHRV